MAEGEHGFLGLTHNPFTEPGDEFFPEGDRKTLLDQLRHLSQWSRHVMLVTGPQGAGKTMLYRQLSMTLEPRVKAARINGLLMNSAKDVLSAIVQGFGAAMPQESSVGVIAETLSAYMIHQDRQGRYCLVMVDDAHRLSFQSLEELLKIARNSPVRFLFFGEPSLVSMVAKSADRLEVEWHEMRLSGYSENEIQSYLNWRFGQAQYRDKLPFTSDQIAKLGKMSAGMPGEINRIAGDLLERIESGDNGEKRRFPVAHRLLVVLLVAVVGVAYLVFSDNDARREQSRQEISEVTKIPLPGTVEETPQPEPRQPELPEPKALNPVEEAATDVPTGVAVRPEVEPVAEEPAVNQVAETQAVPRQQPQQEPQQPEAKPELTVVEPDPVPVEERAVPSVSEPQTASADGAAKDESWLLAQPENYFTMQLVSVSSEERVRAFIDKQKTPGDFAWYTLKREDRTLYVITYGLFETVEAARAASQSLPEEVGNLEPWIRKLSFVQDAAR